MAHVAAPATAQEGRLKGVVGNSRVLCVLQGRSHLLSERSIAHCLRFAYVVLRPGT